jgi:hypothetical protein
MKPVTVTDFNLQFVITCVLFLLKIVFFFQLMDIEYYKMVFSTKHESFMTKNYFSEPL